MTAILETHALGLRYGRRPALSDCTLNIPPGRVTGLVGPNGAGKSTLLKLACGLLTPDSGSISVLGDTPGSGADQLAGSASSPRTPPCIRTCPSPTTSGSART